MSKSTNFTNTTFRLRCGELVRMSFTGVYFTPHDFRVPWKMRLNKCITGEQYGGENNGFPLLSEDTLQVISDHNTCVPR